MVNAIVSLALWATVLGPVGDVSTPAQPDASVRPVLKQEGFPWYDANSGRVIPVLSREFRFQWADSLGKWASKVLDRISKWFTRLNRWRLPGIGRIAGFGDLLMIGLAMMLLTVVLVVLLELLRRYRPTADDDAARSAALRAGSARRIEGLPAGVRLDGSDPWELAQRLRARGDYSGAVVHLFAHQLMSLDRLKHVRLVPGRTGRQLVRNVSDRQLRGLVEPTLRLFEAVYYGHRAPSATAFEAVWSQALEFQSRLAPEVVT